MVAGGGGAANTGVKNGFEVFQVNFLFNASPSSLLRLPVADFLEWGECHWGKCHQTLHWGVLSLQHGSQACR